MGQQLPVLPVSSVIILPVSFTSQFTISSVTFSYQFISHCFSSPPRVMFGKHWALRGFLGEGDFFILGGSTW